MTAPAQRKQVSSLAVWDIGSPAVAGERFSIKAGVKSSADCDLRGRRIEVCNAAGAVIGEGRLGAAAWPGTSALYWTELSLPAPAEDGIATFSVRFLGAGVTPPHADSVATFSLAVAHKPEHVLSVTVVTDTGRPIEGAEICLGPYRATTDRMGAAALRVCRGAYEMRIWKIGFDAPPAAVTVLGDASFRIDAATTPQENADRAWKM